MIIENVSKSTSEELLKELVKTPKEDCYKKILLALFLLIIGIPVIIYGFMEDVISTKVTYLIMGFLLIALSIVYGIINIFKSKKIISKVKNEYTILLSSGLEYTFKIKESSIDYSIKVKDKTTRASYSFTNLKKIKEDSKSYYLTFNENHVITVTNNGNKEEIIYNVLEIKKNGFKDSKEEAIFRKNITKNSKRKIKLIKDKK